MAISTAGALLGGAGLNLVGGLMGADATRDAARIAAEAAKFDPVNIHSGFGSTTFTEGGGFQSTLSPELQALRDQLLGVGRGALGQFQTFDPVAAGGLFTQQLNALAAPTEQQNRLSLENRLFQQGLTGGTTGAKRTEALLGAQALAQGQRDLTGLQLGQQQQERLFQNALGGIQGATALDQLAANQLNQAISAGGANTMANTNAANFQFQAAQNSADAISGFFGNLGSGLSQMAFAPQPQASFFSQPVAGTSQADMLAAQNAGLF